LKYRLVYTQKAVRDIDRLDAGAKKRIGATLLRFKDNPLSHAEHLTNSELGGYRFRIGDYRGQNDMGVLAPGRKDIFLSFRIPATGLKCHSESPRQA
jgi:mRNA interferase RelE/StbE